MDIISRKQAQIDGLSKYFTGKLCVNGHIAERYTASGTCQECINGKPVVKEYDNSKEIHSFIQYYFSPIRLRTYPEHKLTLMNAVWLTAVKHMPGIEMQHVYDFKTPNKTEGGTFVLTFLCHGEDRDHLQRVASAILNFKQFDMSGIRARIAKMAEPEPQWPDWKA